MNLGKQSTMRRFTRAVSALAVTTPRRAASIIRQLSAATGRDDIVPPAATFPQIDELRYWIEHERATPEAGGVACRLRPISNKVPKRAPGCDKLLTVNLLGKASARPVVRIDLSATVSEYIGETEKNLARLLEAAGARNQVVLFFDEADALFGKSTAVKDAHDRYANLEIAYVLGRVADSDGLAILGSNLQPRIDDTLLRRFDAIIRFPFPTAVERTAVRTQAFGVISDRGDRNPLAKDRRRGKP